MEVDLARGRMEALDGPGPTHWMRISGSEPAALILLPIDGPEDAPVPVDAQGKPDGDWPAAMRVLTSIEPDPAVPESWTIRIDARQQQWNLTKVRQALASFVITPENRSGLLRAELEPVPFAGAAGLADPRREALRAQMARWRAGQPNRDDLEAVAQRMLRDPVPHCWTLDLP